MLIADRISEIESQIGAGLIEEVIQVAEGEHELADKMAEDKM
jgi:NADH dehydrogenase (ubiquinone) 1 alpha subcomplex subunit 5